jgi:hypothetical protein
MRGGRGFTSAAQGAQQVERDRQGALLPSRSRFGKARYRAARVSKRCRKVRGDAGRAGFTSAAQGTQQVERYRQGALLP